MSQQTTKQKRITSIRFPYVFIADIDDDSNIDRVRKSQLLLDDPQKLPPVGAVLELDHEQAIVGDTQAFEPVYRVVAITSASDCVGGVCPIR